MYCPQNHKLTFAQHIKQKCKNATTVLNLLKRNLHFAPKSVKRKAYTSCVLPIIEYASNCWSPTSDKSNHDVEMVQHNAARFISNIYHKKGDFKNTSITKILKDLNLETLEERRIQSRLIMAYKILNEKVILESNLLPKFLTTRPRQCQSANVGLENQLVEPQPRLQVTGHTFFYSIPTIWNQRISKQQANAPSVDSFKNHFRRTK